MAALIPTTITIGATNYDENARIPVGLLPDAWSWDLDDDLTAEFHEDGPNIPVLTYPNYHGGQTVKISVNPSGTPIQVFQGEISNVEPVFGDYGWTFGYRARGPKYQANLLYITGRDGTGEMLYNVDQREPGFSPSLAGLTVGAIIADVLTVHSTLLATYNISTDSTTTTQLTSGFLNSIIPVDAVYLQGRLWQAIDEVLRRWAPNYASFIDGNGKIRFFDTLVGTDITLQEGTDSFDPFRFSYDLSDCATRVVVRGSANVASLYVSVLKNTLQPAWTNTQQNNWKYADYIMPGLAYDKGTVNSIVSATDVNLSSSITGRTYGVNFWPTRQAWIHLFKGAGTGIDYHESRPITANTALTSGGNYDVTLAFALDNAGLHDYNTYDIIGTAAPLSDLTDPNNRVDVWRLYNVVTPGNYAEAHLVSKFPTYQPFFGYYGEGYGMTLYPEALIVGPQGESWPATFKLVPQSGQVRFDEPVVKAINSQSALNKGGTSVTAPVDVYMLLGYSRGALTATYPADISGVPQYQGSAYTLFGLQRTAYIDVDNWVYQGNQPLFNQYAQMMAQSRGDAIFNGTVPYKGAMTNCFYPGVRLSITGTGYTTSHETLKIPIRGFTLQYFHDGQRGMLYGSKLRCSSRRNPNTAERMYVHPTTLEQLYFKLPSGIMSGEAALNMSQFQIGPQAYQQFGQTPISQMPGQQFSSANLSNAQAPLGQVPLSNLSQSPAPTNLGPSLSSAQQTQQQAAMDAVTDPMNLNVANTRAAIQKMLFPDLNQ